MPDVLQGGAEGRPPRRGGRVAAALVVALLAGAAVWQVMNGSGGGAAPDAVHGPAAAPASVPPSQPATQAVPHPVTSLSAVAPIAGVNPPATGAVARSRPWHQLSLGPPLEVDRAWGHLVTVQGRTRDLGLETRVVSMDDAAGGPVLLVSGPDAVSLEQLRPDGARLVLDDFAGERRLPQGVAVDPTGRFVVYGVTSVVPGSNSLVVRDLTSGSATVRLRTKLPFSVADWTSAGVVLQAALDPGGPPYVWSPGPSRPRHIVGFAHGSSGPFLLASAPTAAQWLVTRPEPGCTDVVGGVSSQPTRSFCADAVDRPATWAPRGSDLVAATNDAQGIVVFDVRDGRTTALHSPARVVVEQVLWSGPRTVLAVVADRAFEHEAVLRCRIGGRCERAALPGGAGKAAVGIVLAR